MVFLSLPIELSVLKDNLNQRFINYHDGTQNNRTRNQALHRRTHLHRWALCIQCIRSHGRCLAPTL